jgi:tetratricopeptide (TPR) repeat protein
MDDLLQIHALAHCGSCGKQAVFFEVILASPCRREKLDEERRLENGRWKSFARGEARLALRIAELVSGSRDWGWRLQGYAGAALTNAYRVCSDLPAARKARAWARQLWDDGEPGDPGLLNEALLPWVEAALYRDEREFSLAVKRINEALELDNGELRGKILLTKGYIHHTMDEPEASTAAILKAIPLIDIEKEPRLGWVVIQNLIGDLIHLGRAEEARRQLPEARRLAERLGGKLDLTRVLWYEARVAEALGDLRGAHKSFEQVRSTFARPELSYDHALVTMELSTVLLKQAENARVRALADEMLRIFQSQNVYREALVALQIFCEAARRDAATVELAQRVSRYLLRAQDNPELKFEAGVE